MLDKNKAQICCSERTSETGKCYTACSRSNCTRVTDRYIPKINPANVKRCVRAEQSRRRDRQRERHREFCWNIQGLHSSTFGSKSTDPVFLKNVKDADIIILTKTWCRNYALTYCSSGYYEVIVPSVKLNTVHRVRDWGGILVWYRITSIFENKNSIH